MIFLRHQNPVWKLFVALFASGTIFYIGFALFQFYQYSRISLPLAPETLHLDVIYQGSDKYALQAQYGYLFEGQFYKGKDVAQARYLNPWAAREALVKWEGSRPSIYIDPNHPHISAIEKNFPYKPFFYAVCLSALLLYLIYLDRYVI